MLSTLLLALAAPFPLWAGVSFNALFQDHAVLQNGQPVPVWGKAEAGEAVTVTYRGQTASTQADAQGNWRVKLEPMPSSAEPASLVAKGASSEATCADVLVGEVWLCSGQSNMVWPLEKSTGGAEAGAAADLPLIRYFMVRKSNSGELAEKAPGAWKVCTPETAKDLSGVAFFMARDLQAELKVPVGIIQSAVSGSQIETWISEQTILNDPTLTTVRERYQKGRASFDEDLAKYNVDLAAYRARKEAAEAAGEKSKDKTPRPPMGPGYVNFPTGHYNAMIHPLATYGIRGAVWYQGEGNATRGVEYQSLMPALIKQWRGEWGQGDFPFLIVQLPLHGDTPWTFAKVREAQAMTARALPKTYLVVTLDLGMPKNLHPPNKLDVGLRVAKVARKEVYGQSDVKCYGPVFTKAERAGSQLRLSFTHAEGLRAKGGKPLGFEVAGADGKFTPADAVIGEGGVVTIGSADVKEPAMARYGWNTPEFTLYNSADLPMAPFLVEVK